jgi:hypothetical protein
MLSCVYIGMALCGSIQQTNLTNSNPPMRLLHGGSCARQVKKMLTKSRKNTETTCSPVSPEPQRRVSAPPDKTSAYYRTLCAMDDKALAVLAGKDDVAYYVLRVRYADLIKGAEKAHYLDDGYRDYLEDKLQRRLLSYKPLHTAKLGSWMKSACSCIARDYAKTARRRTSVPVSAAEQITIFEDFAETNLPIGLQPISQQIRAGYVTRAQLFKIYGPKVAKVMLAVIGEAYFAEEE